MNKLKYRRRPFVNNDEGRKTKKKKKFGLNYQSKLLFLKKFCVVIVYDGVVGSSKSDKYQFTVLTRIRTDSKNLFK